MKTKENSTENFIKIIKELKEENEQLKQQNQWLMEQFRLSKHKKYCASSEHNCVDQMCLFNEAETTAALTIPQPGFTEVKAYHRKKAA
jgi:transposase